MRPRPCRRLQLLASVATTLLLLILETRTTARAAHPSRVAECLARAADSGQLDELELHEAAVEDQQLGYLEPIRSLATRRALSLNGLYDFCFDAARAGFQQRWFERPLAEACPPSEFHRMPVPSAFNELLSNETARNFMGWTWYQSQFRLWPASLAGRQLIQFESINYLGLVWAQVVSAPGRKGQPARLVGAHAGGHLPVVVDLSELLETLRPLEGLEELGLELRLSVAVSNQLSRDTIPSGQMVNLTQVAGRPAFKFRPDFDFFHFAGLLGDVQLVRLPPVYIKRASVSRQPDGRLNLRLCLAHYDLASGAPVELTVWWGSRELRTPLAGGATRVRTVSGECLDWPLPCNGTECPRLLEWPSRRRPARLTLRLRPSQGPNAGALKQVDDVYELALVQARATDQLVERLLAAGGQLQGFGMHQEQLFSGRAMSLPAIMKDLNLVKRLGANLIRTSHYPYSRAYLEACDELGIMVIGECAAVGLSSFSARKLRLHKQLLKEMMLRDHEHPAIVAWSLANEPQSEQAEARPYFQALLQFCRHELAEFTGGLARRPLTAAIAQPHQLDQIGDLLDLIMVNQYFGWYDFAGSLETIWPATRANLAGWARKHAGKPLLVSEFGAGALAGLHAGGLFSEEFQRDLIEEHERLFAQLARNRTQSGLNFWGALVWNFADFSTHESLLRPGGNKKGVFTAGRQPKLAALSLERIFNERRRELL